MKVVAIHKCIQESFYRWGWLLPVGFPLTALGGRGLYNTLAGCFGLWGLLALWSRRHRLDPTTTIGYLLVLGVFLAGIPGTANSEEGLRQWLGFLAPSLALLLVQSALWETPDALDRLLVGIAFFGMLTLIGLYALLLYYRMGWSGQPFNPQLQLQEDNLPFLLPFLLIWAWRCGDGVQRYWRMAGFLVLILAYVVIAEGRAALVGLVVASVVFGRTVLGWRWRWITGGALIVLAVAIIANTGPFRKSALDPEQPLDAFTAGRTVLWRQALEHPPERWWFGVGLGNGRQAVSLLSFELNGESVQVHHFHNFLIDAWYETGLLGVGALVALIGMTLWRTARVWRQLSAPDRQRAGVLLAAALAILASAMLSFAYTSRHFAYLFLCFGALIYLTRVAAKASGR